MLRLISLVQSLIFGDNMRCKLVKVSLVTIVLIVLVTPVSFESTTFVGDINDETHCLEDITTDFILTQDIVIETADNFTQFGFTGSGTVGDPYLLEDEIFDEVLTIRHTDYYFEIRNCQFIGSWPDSYLQIYNVSNGLVAECMIASGALFLSTSHDCILRDNVVFTQPVKDTHNPRMIFPGGDLGWGLIVGSSNDTTIENNTVFHTEHGIQADGYRITVRNNNIHSNLFWGLVASSIDSLYVDNSIYGHVEQTYNTGTSGEAAIDCYGENSTFYGNSIGWNNDHVDISTSGGVKPNQWDNGIDTGNAWSGYIGPGPYVLETDNVDNYPSLLEDTTAPIIMGPNDVVREWGSPSSVLTWTIEEEFPTLYEVYFDNEFVWGGGIYQDTIQYPLTSLDIGTYNFTLKIFDAAGHTSNHTVNVEITPMNHNLVWGLEEDTTLVFDFYTVKDTTTINTRISDRLEMTVTELPEIPDRLDYVPFCPYATSWVQSNDTLPSLEYFFAGAGSVWAIISPAVPTGNWSLLSSFIGVVESESLNISIVDDSVIWGIRIDIEESGVSLASETTWLKSDGSLQKVILSIESDVGSVEVSLRRPGLIVGNLTVILITGAAISVALAVVVIIKVRRR